MNYSFKNWTGCIFINYVPTITLPFSARELPGGKRAVVLVVISKLSHRSACLEQSIHPTLTRPSCREKQVEERLQCSFMLTRQKHLLLNALRLVTLKLNLVKHDQLNAYQHSSKLPPCLRFQTICKEIWLFRKKEV